MDSQRIRWPRESSRYRISKAPERSRVRALSRPPHDRRGIHVVACGFASDLSRRPRLQPEVEHGLDERHAEIFLDRSDLSPVRAKQADLFPALCLHRKFRASLLAR